MGTNSILSNLNSEDMISTIRLEMGNDLKKENIYLLIEGFDDKKLFQYLCNNNVVVCESYSGKKGIEEILSAFNENYRILGIRDRDYETRKLDDRIFFYDYCCMEMMLVNMNEVFERVFYEYYEGSIDFEDLRYEILEKLKTLSVLRKVNEYHRKMWNFKGINRQIIFNNTDFNEEELYKELSRVNNREICEDDNIRNEKENTRNYNDLLSLTNGHDFIDLFIIYCKKENGKNLKINTISETMRCSCSLENFKQSVLYNDLFKYQTENNIKIIK